MIELYLKFFIFPAGSADFTGANFCGGEKNSIGIKTTRLGNFNGCSDHFSQLWSFRGLPEISSIFIELIPEFFYINLSSIFSKYCSKYYISAVKIMLDLYIFQEKKFLCKCLLTIGNIYFSFLYISLRILRKFIYQDPANLNYSNYIGGWLIGNIFRKDQ